MNGTVKFFNTAKGFGFIEPDGGGKDIFVHASALETAGIRMLNEGDRVSFELEDEGEGKASCTAHENLAVHDLLTFACVFLSAERHNAR